MDKKQWTIAHDIAFDLVDWGTDPNELGKVIAFLRRNKGDNVAKDRLMSLVQRLASSRNALIRSRQTQRFYQNIREVCEDHLYDINDTTELLCILGWSLRLMRYYRVEPERAVEEQRQPQKSKQAPKPRPPQTSQLQKAPEKPKVKIGDKVNATILKKNGSKVTVELQTDAREILVFERPYYPGLVGARIKLRVQAVNENGLVTTVIP